MADEVRLLLCRRCETVEELPDYAGPADEDFLLQHVVARHQRCTPGGAQVGGQDPTEALQGDRALARVERKHWNAPETRQQILAQLGVAATGFEQKFYDVRNTFQEDALKCYAKHMRPKDGCIDYKEQAYEVGNALLTEDERKARTQSGLLLRHDKQTQKKVYLCDFCPVKSKVQEKVFKKRGLYKK